MDAVLSDKECGYYMKLFIFIIGIGMEVLHTYFEQNILNAKEHLEFYMFLDENKHNLFHECYPRVKCCKCSQNGRGMASQKGCLTKKQFTLLFEIDPLIELDHYKIGNQNETTQECLCRIIPKRSNDVDCMDITLMYAIFQSCCLKNTTVLYGNPRCIETIKETRNFLVHVPNQRISKSEFDTKWSETEQAILEIGSSLGNYFAKVNQKKIDAFKRNDLSIERIKEIIENNIDEIVKKKLQTVIEDQRESTLLIKDEIMKHLTKYKDELSIDIRNLRFEVQQYASASRSTQETSDTQVPKMNAAACDTKEYDTNVGKCRVEWRLETPCTWNLPEIKQTLEKFSALLRQWFEIEFVYIGSLVIKTLVHRNILVDQEEMRTAVHLFLEKFVEVCRIDADVPTVVKVALIVEPDEFNKEETEEQSSKIDLIKKDKTICIFCKKSFDCQNCRQKNEIISNLKEEISENSKESSAVLLESVVSEIKKDPPETESESAAVLQSIGDDPRANKAQVATGHVLSPTVNYTRLIIAVKVITQNMLRELLEQVIPQKDFMAKIEDHQLRHQMTSDDVMKIPQTRNGYIDFDYTLICKILRHEFLGIDPLSELTPPIVPMHLAVTINQCKRLCDVIIDRPNPMVTSQEFNNFLTRFIRFAKSFEILLKKQPNEFVYQFEDLRLSRY